VLLTTDTVGGVWTYTLELAAAYGTRGIQVVLAALGQLPRPDQISDAQRVPGLSLHALECRLPWMDDPWADVEAASRWLTALARETRPDIAHLSEPVLAAADWSVPTVAVGHSCVLSWWQAVLGEPAPPSWERYRDAMRTGFAAATAVVAPTHWMRDALRRYYDVRSARVIANGRGSSAFSPAQKEGLILTATRVWDSAKNVLALDRASAGLPWPVYAAGDDRPPGAAGSVGAEHVCLLGRLSAHEIAGWMSRAAVFALPARYEPFGLSVLEAALAGCALVLGDIPSLRETWDGVAVFVPPDDDRMLRVALEGLIGDPALRQTLAMRARRRALGLTGERMAQSYLELYGSLLPGPRPRRPSREMPACAS
jgi:glycosyltransferase involved in cell wall biosynthesis